MRDLFFKDNKRFEWLKDFLNLKDYKIKEDYGYRRQTRYEKYIAEVKAANEEARQKKLETLKEEFDKQKEDFYRERNAILNKIKQDIIDLGFKNIKLPQLEHQSKNKNEQQNKLAH